MFDFSFIPVAEASVLTLMKSINKVIINPIIIFLFACAMAYFLYGLAQYLLSPGNEEVHKKSKSVMLWGVIGLFIMTAVFGIMRVVLNTVGVNTIKINNNGDYVVDNTAVTGSKSTYDPVTGVFTSSSIADNKNSGQDLLNGGVDISINNNAPTLDAATFTKNPFPSYEANALCWNNQNKPFVAKAPTEYDALKAVKLQARKKYLSDNNLQPEKKPEDEAKAKYPVLIGTKVLYDKTNTAYYAWLDARAPIGKGTMSDCNLKVLEPAPVLPDSLVSSEVDIASSLDAPDLPPAAFINNPFPVYKTDALCWNRAITSGKSTTEYNALTLVNANTRKQYLKDNPSVSPKDKDKINYPISFASITLYDKKEKAYYAWVDARAPIGKGTIENCDLEAIQPGLAIPDSAVFSGQLNLSSTVLNSDIADYTKSPFTQIYQPSAYCWRDEIPASAATEYEVNQDIEAKAQTAYVKYLKDHNLMSSYSDKYPIAFGVLSAYDKVTKKYYVWWDARAPLGDGTINNCSLLVIGSKNTLPAPTAQSAKKNPLSKPYLSDADYYRGVGSGVSPDYTTARNIAINNALIRIAQQKHVTSTAEITVKTIAEEKYYKKDTTTGNYDYWVAIESLRSL